MTKKAMTNREMIGPKINLQSMQCSNVSEEIKDRLLELQLRMATSSINHEYAKLEFEDTEDHIRKEELLDFMDDCRIQYLEARLQLQIHNPSVLEDFETDLVRQKQAAITTQFNA